MKALFYEGVKTLTLRDVPREPVGPDEVRVAIRGVGICGSDVHGWLGLTGRRNPPMIMGHEAAGQVTEVGPGVDKGLLGKHVVIVPFTTCGTCPACLNGAENCCPDKQIIGVKSVNGAMRDEMVIPAKDALVIPDEVPFEYAAMVEPLAVGLTGIKKTDVKGRRVVVVGAGTIGAMCALVAKQFGAAEVAAVDVSDARLEAIRNSVADLTFNSREMTPAEILAEAGPFDVAVEAAGFTQTLQTAAELLGIHGDLIVLGMNEKFIPFEIYSMVTREVTAHFSFNYTHADFEEAARMLPELEDALDKLPVLNIPLEQGPEYFEKLASGVDTWTKVVLHGREENHDEQ